MGWDKIDLGRPIIKWTDDIREGARLVSLKQGGLSVIDNYGDPFAISVKAAKRAERSVTRGREEK